MSVFTSGNISATFTPEVTWDQLTLLEYDKDLQLRENMKQYYDSWRSVANNANSYTFTTVDSGTNLEL